MPDTRKHRGPHPADAELFHREAWPALQQACCDLSWLLTRDYPPMAALKLVGDRFHHTDRQRLAVMRSSCSDTALAGRTASQFRSDSPENVHHPRDERARSIRPVLLDGFNLLTTIEAALAGGVILEGRDGCYRDMASMHGNYRKVEETRPAIQLIGKELQVIGADQTIWFLDSPVSNSGRLSQILRDIAAEQGWNWQTELVNDPDPILAASLELVVSADSVILDGCQRWYNLARRVVDWHVPGACVVPMWPESQHEA